MTAERPGKGSVTVDGGEGLISLKAAREMLDMTPNGVSLAIRRGDIKVRGQLETDRRIKLVSEAEVKEFARNRRYRKDRKTL